LRWNSLAGPMAGGAVRAKGIPAMKGKALPVDAFVNAA
jgi:hypothetical protein